jgi:hypothetical protein
MELRFQRNTRGGQYFRKEKLTTQQSASKVSKLMNRKGNQKKTSEERTAKTQQTVNPD